MQIERRVLLLQHSNRTLPYNVALKRDALHMRFVRSVYNLTYLPAWIPAASKQEQLQQS
jgi:hypothetical protein